jgi:hypothetical protein
MRRSAFRNAAVPIPRCRLRLVHLSAPRAALAIAAIALLALVACDDDDTPGAVPEPTLPALDLPARIGPSPAGDYGWQGGPGDGAFMHLVVGDGVSSREATEMTFAVGADCLGAFQGQQEVSVRVAGFEGKSVEPYEPPVPFGTRGGGQDGDEITRAHALDIGDRTLCVFLTWHATTTVEELDAAEKILDTLRAEPVGEDQIRVTFTLEEGWDTG